eukprot:403355307
MSGYGRQAPSSEDYIMQSMMIKMTMSINKQCFMECVNNFSSDKLSQQESTCISQCAKRQSSAFMAMNDIQGQLQSKSGSAMF